ncbi:MAG TPA: FAD-dependent oxidoreductase [Candidatus Saccharimonas sp.]|nr:FAD-dependent oxidoreductase [Candidatus Saccharimonas sp.]
MKLLFDRREAQTGNATTFIFTPVKPTTWVAGQSIRLEVPGVYEPLEHRFTISSAPSEGHIAITTRNSGSMYKQSLFGLAPGTSLDAYAIEGKFIWQESTSPHLFVAAGMGITPVRSIIKERLNAGLPIAATLLYAAREPIFKDEIATWAHNVPEFTAHFLSRHITADDVATANPQGLIYITGPSTMVDNISAALIQNGVAENRLVRDWFTGLASDVSMVQ